MKKLLQHSCLWLVALVAMIAASTTAVAQNVTWNFDTDANSRGNGGLKDGVSVFAQYWIGDAANLYSEDLTGTGYGWVRVSSNDEILVKIVFHGDDGMQTLICSNGRFTELTATVATWEGHANEVMFSSTSDVYARYVDVYYDEGPIDDTDYTLVLVDAPADATVTIDGTPRTDGETWTVDKKLRLTDLVAAAPAGYYTEASYDADTHTFTVTYRHWYYYDVVIVIPTYIPNAALYDGSRYYQSGQQIASKQPLDASHFTAYDLDGYDSTVTLTPGADPYHATVTATYTSAAEKTYYIVFADGTPAGTNVAVQGHVYYANATLLSPYDLRYYDFIVTAPDGYYADDSYTSYDPAARTFTVNVHEYYNYLVQVVGVSSRVAGVVYNGTTYTDRQTIAARTPIDATSLDVAKVEGYEGCIAIDGSTVTVTYTKPEYIVVDTSQYREGGVWTLEGSDVTIHGAGVPLNLWHNPWGANWTATVRSNSFAIEKIEFVDRDGDTMFCNVSCGSFADNVWTCDGGEYYSVTFDPNGGGYYNDGDYYITSVRVWLKGEGEPAPKLPFDYLKVSPAAGELAELGRYITIYAGDTDWENLTEEGESFATFISTFYGDPVPSGVTLTDADATPYAIDDFVLSGHQINVILAQPIVTPGTYTLRIPPALGETVSGKVNGEWTVAWTVVATDPENTTGLGTVLADGTSTSAAPALYTLQGQRRATPSAPGLYIKGGQKIIVRQ